MTSSPFSLTQSRSPFIVISNEFHSPRGRSAFFLGVTAARTSAGIFLSVRVTINLPGADGPHPNVHLALVGAAQVDARIGILNLDRFIFAVRPFFGVAVGQDHGN